MSSKPHSLLLEVLRVIVNLPSRLLYFAVLAVTGPGCPEVIEEAGKRNPPLVDLLRFWKTICISVDAGGGSGTLVFYTLRPMSG